jgi:hypothetical protein
LRLTRIAVLWGDWKQWVEAWLQLSPDALHIHAGIILWLLFALVTRRSLEHPLPWLLLLGVELANEAIDLNQPAGSIESNWPASRHDILNTMAMPTLLLLSLGARRWWARRREGRDAAPEAPE